MTTRYTSDERLAVLETRMKSLETALARMEGKVDEILAAENKRIGASSIWALLAKSPAVGWIVGISAAAWAVMGGKQP